MKTEIRKIEELKNNKKNPRTIRNEKFKQLVKSIQEFPEMLDIRPIVVDETDTVLGGNMRLKAAKEAGLLQVPTIKVEGLTEEQKKEFIIKDNASFGDWDWGLLKQEWNMTVIGDWGLDVFEMPEINILGLTENYLSDSDEENNESDNVEENAFNEEVFQVEKEIIEKTKLSDRFIVPPFSVFDTRQAYWTQRKRSWKELGIKSEIGRDGNLMGYSETILKGLGDAKEVTPEQVREYILFTRNKNNSKNQGLGGTIPGYYDKKDAGKSDEEIVKEFLESGNISGAGTSVFDPVLCEISYKWFCQEGGSIFDPFAGGSVRGIVAAKLGYDYTGIELRKEQVEANLEQVSEILSDSDKKPEYIIGTSEKTHELLGDRERLFDLIFTCPPYYDLEVYSDDPEDLSTMEYKEFEAAYDSIIKQSCERLKEDSFSVFVVGDVRDKEGFYLDFIGKTIAAHEKCGVKYYNQAILLGPVGMAAMKAGRNFNGARKLTKTHQNVLVFYKGNPKNIKAKFGEMIFESTEQTDFVESTLETTYGEKIEMKDL